MAKLKIKIKNATSTDSRVINMFIELLLRNGCALENIGKLQDKEKVKSTWTDATLILN
jgi:hypothetical protein